MAVSCAPFPTLFLLSLSALGVGRLLRSRGAQPPCAKRIKERESNPRNPNENTYRTPDRLLLRSGFRSPARGTGRAGRRHETSAKTEECAEATDRAATAAHVAEHESPEAAHRALDECRP